MTGFFQRLLNVRRDELPPVLLSALLFFCVLTALMLLRPAREALGMQRGIETVRWLFVGTALATLLINPLFGLLVSRLRRMAFIALIYGFFAISLLVFYLVMVLAPEAIGVTSGQLFYVWFSVFNLFSTMVFWALMADRFSLEQSKRFFGAIAVGGTCGAIAGPALASFLAAPLGTPALLLISAGLLLLAVALAFLLSRLGPRQHGARIADAEQERIGGSAWEGLRAVFRSRYLLGLAAYVIILAMIATFIYFTRLHMVAALGADLDFRTTLFARIDVATQAATLLMQLLLAGHLMRRFGVAVALALLPLTVMLGFLGLAITGSLLALVVFEAVFRTVQRALMRPARETLYTVLSREDKYKSKAVIDTFVYRGGDVLGAQVEGLLGRLGLGLAALASVAMPLALLWMALGIWLGRIQQQLAMMDSTTAAGVSSPLTTQRRPMP